MAGSKGEKVADKYRNKGLRVVAIDVAGGDKTQSEKKWKNAGADFYLYDKNMNCFKQFYKSLEYYPHNVGIKDGKSIKLRYPSTEEEVKTLFNF